MKPGDNVNDFTLTDQNGNDFNLYNNLDKNVLIVFYPKDDTPVCTKQLTNYQEGLSDFKEENIKVVGINIGSQKSHASFCQKNNIDFPLLSDELGEISKKFGAVNFFGVNKRMLVLVGKDRKIKYVDSVFPLTYLSKDRIIEELKKFHII